MSSVCNRSSRAWTDGSETKDVANNSSPDAHGIIVEKISTRKSMRFREKVQSKKYVIKRLRILLGSQARFGLPGTSGNFWSCFRAHFIQEHSFVSLLSAHELHPFSRRERIPVFFNYICVEFFLATVFVRGTLPFYVASLLIAGISSFYAKVLRSLVEVRCCIGCDCAEKCCRGCGRWMTAWVTLMSVALAAIGVMFAIREANRPKYTNEWFVPLWLLAQLLSIVLVDPFVLFYLQFMSWAEEKKKFQSKFGPLFPSDVPPVSISEIGLFVADRSPEFNFNLRLGPDTSGKYSLSFLEWLIAPRHFWEKTLNEKVVVVSDVGCGKQEGEGGRSLDTKEVKSAKSLTKRNGSPSPQTPTAGGRVSSRHERQALLQLPLPVQRMDANAGDIPQELALGPTCTLSSSTNVQGNHGDNGQTRSPKISCEADGESNDVRCANDFEHRSAAKTLSVVDVEGRSNGKRSPRKVMQKLDETKTSPLFERSDTVPLGAPPLFEDSEAQASTVTDEDRTEDVYIARENENVETKGHKTPPAIFVDPVHRSHHSRKLIYDPASKNNIMQESDESFPMGKIIVRPIESQNKPQHQPRPPNSEHFGHTISRSTSLGRLKAAETIANNNDGKAKTDGSRNRSRTGSRNRPLTRSRTKYID